MRSPTSPQTSFGEFDKPQILQNNPKNTMAIRVVSPAARNQRGGGQLSPVQPKSALESDMIRLPSTYVTSSPSNDNFSPSFPEGRPSATQKSTVSRDSPRHPEKPQPVSSPPGGSEILSGPTFPMNPQQRVDSPRIITPDMEAESSNQWRQFSQESGKSNDSYGTNNVNSHPSMSQDYDELSPPLQYHHRHMSEASGVKMVEDRSSNAPSQR